MEVTDAASSSIRASSVSMVYSCGEADTEAMLELALRYAVSECR